MSRDHTSPNPFLDSSYSHGYPVQFPLQGNAGPLRQTGHATERNNYVGGAAAQFPDLAIERSAASFPSAAPFQPFYRAVFPRATRDADGVEEMFSWHQKPVDLKQGQAVKAKKMARDQAKASGPILRLRCLSTSGRKGWKKWKVAEAWRPGRRLLKLSTRQALLKQ